MRLTYRYSIPTSGRPDVDGVEYTTESDDVVITITHNIGKRNATIEVTNSLVIEFIQESDIYI